MESYPAPAVLPVLTTHHPGSWCRRDTVTGNSEAAALRVVAAVPVAALAKINMQINLDTK